MEFKKLFILSLLITGLAGISCGPTGELMLPSCGPESENNPECIPLKDEPNATEGTAEEGKEGSELMIISLADYYNTQSNEIPEGYQELKIPKEVEVDLTKGFRIQIYSGQSLEMADTTAMHFRAWSDTTLVGYQPETYTFFKTPNYRVHIGDFHDRERALALSRVIKRFFRDAWVVYDTVDPYAVPSDTVEITIR